MSYHVDSRVPGPGRCRECGAELPVTVAEGACPTCLLGLALAPVNRRANRKESPDLVRTHRMLGGYELIEEIARGSMGVVWKARQLGLNRLVAFRMLHTGSLGSVLDRLRFSIEVEALAKLCHPNIVSLHELGESEGIHFLTMTLVEGGTLAAAMGQGEDRLPMRSLVGLMAKVARAVHYAHQHGVLHRDLKPSNILLDPSGEPMVADFGLARAGINAGVVTWTGAAPGTPEYMAPEQARGDVAQVSTAADIYAMGVILHELVSGRPPHPAGRVLDGIGGMRGRDVPAPIWRESAAAGRSRAELRDFDTIILKCLHSNPSGRYESAAALAEELDRWLEGQPIRARRMEAWEKAWRWCLREPDLAGALAVSALLVVAVSGGAFWHGWKMDQSRQRIAVQASEFRRHNLTLQMREAEALFGRDESAKGVAILASLVRSDPGNISACARLTSALKSRAFGRPAFYPLVHTANARIAHLCEWSDRIVTLTEDGVVRQWDGSRGESVEREWGLPAEATEPELVLDGRAVLVVQGAMLQWWDLDRREKYFEREHGRRISGLRVSPDGSRVASWDREGGIQVWGVGLADSIGKRLESRREVIDVRFAGNLTNRLAIATADGTVEVWNLEDGQVLWGRSLGIRESIKWAVDPTGVLVAIGFGANVEFRMLETGKETRPPALPPARVSLVEFSPKEPIVAVVSSGAVGHEVQLESAWDVEAPVVRISHRQEIRSLAFSKDGRRLATGCNDRTARVWAVADGRPEIEPLQHSRGVYGVEFNKEAGRLVTRCYGGAVWVWQLPPPPVTMGLSLGEPILSAAFDPSGGRVALGGQRGRLGIWRLGQAWRGETVEAHRGPVWHVEFSADGRWLVSAGEGGSARLEDVHDGRIRVLRHDDWSWVMRARFDGSGGRVVTAAHDHRAIVWETSTGRELVVLQHPEGVNDAGFSPDGRYVLTRSKSDRARLWDAANGGLVADGMVHSAWVDAVRFSPDGRWVLTGSRDASVRLWGIDGLLKGRRSPLHEEWVPAGVTDTRFSPDGRWIAAIAEDQTVRLWKIHAPGAGPVLQHDRTVFDAEFDGAGERIATAAGEAGGRVWWARTGQPVSEVLRHPRPVWVVRFSPDGEWVLTAGEDGVARLWPAGRRREWAPEWLPDFAETLAVMKGNTSVGFTQEGVMTWKEFEHLWPGKGDWVRHE